MIPDDGDGVGYFVVCFNSTSATRQSQGLCDAVVPGIAADSNLKNGKLSGTSNECPDGVLLLRPNGSCVDAVGYEGLMPNTGTYGAMFQNPAYNAGRDRGFANFESLHKTTSTLARATSGSEWLESADSSGLANAGQSLVCSMIEDADLDGVPDADDNCPSVANPGQQDTDGDAVGDACNDACNDADDLDGDEYADTLDNCPAASNPGQGDTDADDVGNLCDNCPVDSNPGQEDGDNNGLGDVCEGIAPPSVPGLMPALVPAVGALIGGIGFWLNRRRVSPS